MASTSAKTRAVAAVFVLLMLVALWVAMAEVAQAMQRGCGEGADKPYNKPYTVTYVIHVGYTLCLVVAVVWTMVEHCQSGCHGNNSRKRGETAPLLGGSNESHSSSGSVNGGSGSGGAESAWAHINWRAWGRILIKVAALGVYTNLVGYTYYRSLPLIDVSANVAIYNSSSAFVYLFTLVFRMDHISWLKIGALVVSIGGVCLVQFLANPPAVEHCDGPTAAPTPAPAVSHATEGYILVVISTITYALYEVIYKRWLPPSVFRAAAAPPPAAEPAAAAAAAARDDALPLDAAPSTTTAVVAAAGDADADSHEAQASIWSDVKYSFVTLGMIGVFHTVINWPGILILDATGVETFELPEPRAFASLMVTTVMDSMFNVLLLIGIAITSPLFISVGCLLTIPASIASDWIIHGRVMSGGAFGGVACIGVGFLVLTYAEVREERARRQLAANNIEKRVV
jgi:drug/metabolite transporter (DMT)-like permease